MAMKQKIDFSGVIIVTHLKKCKMCKETLPIELFNKKHDTRDRHQRFCRDCCAIQQRMIKYGVTRDQYLAMMIKQHGVCAICGEPETHYKYLAVDHNHTTGEVRGLLCHSCNPMLGYARDNTKILGLAIQYLKKES